MGAAGTILAVRAIFLSVTDPREHSAWISNLASAFDSPSFTRSLLATTDPAHACRLLNLGLHPQLRTRPRRLFQRNRN